MSDISAIGFVGLGRMGALIAANLVRAGHPLVVWNRNAARSAAFAHEVGGRAAADVAELAAVSDVVFSMVTDGDALKEVFLDDDAVLAALRGKCLVDMSTVGPTFAQYCAAALQSRGIRFVEAPVSGSTAAAATASLTLLVGAEPDDFATVSPLLHQLGSDVRHLGPPGRAALMKVAINSMVLGINQSIAEALVLAERGGFDRTEAYDAFLSSAAAAPVMGYRRELFLQPEGAVVSSTIELAVKDLRLMTDLAGQHGLSTPQAAANLAAAEQASAAGYAQADLSAIAEYLRRREP